MKNGSGIALEIAMFEYFKTGLFRTLWIIRDYLPEVVVGGGWVLLIYYHYVLGDKSRLSASDLPGAFPL